MLALVGTDARVDSQMVLQVVVVDKLGVAVEADVGPFTRVLPHVDLQFVLSVQKKHKTAEWLKVLGEQEVNTGELKPSTTARFKIIGGKCSGAAAEKTKPSTGVFHSISLILQGVENRLTSFKWARGDFSNPAVLHKLRLCTKITQLFSSNVCGV